MRADQRRPLRVLVAAALAAVLVGCTPQPPAPSASGTAAPRPFTVIATGAITSLDPAVAIGTAESSVVTSVYQRLMQVAIGSGDLKPDAATDCAFTSRLVYECTLPNTLSFHNGDRLDSADVRFSIQRALRLDAPGTSVGLLSSLVRIETPNPATVRFVLSREDNQFGYALAGQAASIVDRRLFDPDSALPLGSAPVGSGPFAVSKVNATDVLLDRFANYVGPNTAQIDQLKLHIVADSVEAEADITDHSVDAAWACLDSAAQQRVDNQIGNTGAGPRFSRVGLPGVRVVRLLWNPKSKLRADKKLRDGVSKALQSDRTLDSVVPLGVPDQVKAFASGGRVKLPTLTGARINLTLGYDTSDPDQPDLARLLRDRIEELDSVSVRLTTGVKADLYLTSHPAWINNALGWLELYLENPVNSSKAKLAELEAHARATTGTARSADLSELQQQAAIDNTLLPVSQGPGLLLLGPGTKLAGGSFGSGQQLGLWGFSRG